MQFQKVQNTKILEIWCTHHSVITFSFSHVRIDPTCPYVDQSFCRIHWGPRKHQGKGQGSWVSLGWRMCPGPQATVLASCCPPPIGPGMDLQVCGGWHHAWQNQGVRSRSRREMGSADLHLEGTFCALLWVCFTRKPGRRPGSFYWSLEQAARQSLFLSWGMGIVHNWPLTSLVD